MVLCEVWDEDGGSVNARFGIVPHVGEEIEILADGVTRVRRKVLRVRHIALNLDEGSERPRVQLWTENADRT